jgi:hypothetical protein
MKKILTILSVMLLMSISASGQHYVGVRGGYGLGFGRFYMKQEQNIVWGLSSGGVAWKYYSTERFVGGIGAEVEFIQRGYDYNVRKLIDREIVVTDTTFRRVVNSVNLPIIWQPHVTMMGNRLRVFLNLGVCVSYNFRDSRAYYSFRGEVYEELAYRRKLVRDNPFGYGLLGGFGFNVAVAPRWEVMAEGRYYFSYGDILRNRNKYPGDEIHMLIRSNGAVDHPLRSPVDNINISVGVFYRLTEGLQTPVRGSRALRRQLEAERGIIIE